MTSNFLQHFWPTSLNKFWLDCSCGYPFVWAILVQTLLQCKWVIEVLHDGNEL